MSAPEELRVPGYEILAKIAEGASSVVYRARCVRTEREAAIKVPLPHADLERLLNGLRAHAPLAHPNIVSLWEADQLPGGRAADRRGRHRWGVILAFAVGAVISLLINANLLWRR